MIKCLIIEDEEAGQVLLKNKLTKFFPDIEIVAIIDHFNDATAYLQKHEVDLAFVDVHIKGGLGLDLLKSDLLKNSVAIFITAYDKYAIEALNAGASYYFLKPLSNEDFKNGMEIVLSKYFDNKQKEKLFITNTNKTIPIDYDDILFIKSDGTYSLITTDNEVHVSSKNIGFYEQTLPVSLFARPHNSYLVNIQKIAALSKSRNGSIILVNGQEIPVSQRKLSSFIEQFQQSRSHKLR
ncbi:MAG: LytTR family DNA-binding domain-containing protein [Crocinitomicaceae bacterium]